MTTLTAAVDRFLGDLQIGAAALTVRTYATALRGFVGAAGGEGVDRLTLEHIERYAADLKGRKLAPATRDVYLAAVARFYSFCVRKRLLTLDTAEGEELRRMFREYRERRRPLPRIPSRAAVDSLIAEAERRVKQAALTADRAGGDWRRKHLAALRDLALVLVLTESGIRIGEALTLKRGDLEARTEGGHVTYVLKVTGKGSKERRAYIGKRAYAALQRYWAAREDGRSTNAGGNAAVAMFLPHGRNAGARALVRRVLTRQHIEARFRDLAERAGIEGRLTPHWLRGSFADRLLRASGRIEVVQLALGHADITTTKRYAGATPRDVEREHAKLFREERAQ